MRDVQVLRDRRSFEPVPAVARGDVEQAVVLVPAARGRVEVDLLDAVDLAGEAEPQHLAVGAAERVAPTGSWPSTRSRTPWNVVLGCGVRSGVLVRERRDCLGVHGVELAVLARTPGGRRRSRTRCPGRGRRRSPAERARHVEVDVAAGRSSSRYSLPLRSGTNWRPRAVGHLADVVDPGAPHQPLVGRRGDRLGLRERGVLLEHQAEPRLHRILRDRVGDRLTAGGGCRRGPAAGGEQGGDECRRGHGCPPSFLTHQGLPLFLRRLGWRCLMKALPVAAGGPAGPPVLFAEGPGTDVDQGVRGRCSITSAPGCPRGRRRAPGRSCRTSRRRPARR